MAIVSNRKRRFVGKFIGNDVYLLDEWVKEMTRVEKTGENRGFTRLKKIFEMAVTFSVVRTSNK